MCAVPNMAVFCSSLTSWFPGMLFTHFLNDFEIVPVTPIITVITFVFTFHMCCISIVRSLYFRIFSVSFLVTFLSPEIATSINIITDYTVWFVVGNSSVSLYLLVPQYGYLASLTCFYWFWHMFIPVFFVQMYPFPCICWSVVVHTLYHVFLCTVLLPVLCMLILCGLLSRQIVGKVCTCYLSLCSILVA